MFVVLLVIAPPSQEFEFPTKPGRFIRWLRMVTESLVIIPAGEERILVATGRYLGEGFDDARLDTLFLTMPIFWCGLLA